MKIVAQTAYAASGERLRALDAGCVDYISKPIKREQLLSVISKYLI
jgi:CheY-like chemotaxis protein